MLNALRTYVLHGLHTPRAGTGGYQSKTDEMNCASSPQILLHPQKKNSRKRSKKRDARQTKRPSIDPSIMKSESEANHESRAPTQIHALVCNFREKKKKNARKVFSHAEEPQRGTQTCTPNEVPREPHKKTHAQKQPHTKGREGGGGAARSWLLSRSVSLTSSPKKTRKKEKIKIR